MGGNSCTQMKRFFYPMFANCAHVFYRYAFTFGKNFQNCCSTYARLVDSPSLNPRTYQARRQQTKNSRLKTSYSYITLFLLFVYKRYEEVTYQFHAHICISCRRYVVVTYRSIKYTPCKIRYPIRVITVN